MKIRKECRCFLHVFFIVWLVVILGLVGCKGRENSSDAGGTVTNMSGGTDRPTMEVSNEEENNTEVLRPDDSERALRKRIDEMSLAEKVGQMFLVRCPEDAVEGITDYYVGGYVLFAKDFDEETKVSMRKKIALYQEVSKIPLLIAVDEEGGSVVRVSKYPEFRESTFLAPRELYMQGGMERIITDTVEKAELLLSLGINVNLAPVCDISRNRAAFMYARSFGGTAEETAEYVTAVVETAKETGLGSVLKHFPGYGENADTHEGMVYDTRSYETYVENDFKPFCSGVEAGAGAVMVSHNIVQCMDEDVPASLSSEVHRILREELSFDGVVLTDDLYMDAIQDFTGKEAAAVTAVLAGNDMLCCTDFDVQIPAVIAAVEDGRIPEDQIDASVLRVLKWKAELGILE